MSEAHDAKYFRTRSYLLDQSTANSRYRNVAGLCEPRFAPHGYSLVNCRLLTGMGGGHTSRGKLVIWLCVGANASAFIYRFSERCKRYAQRQLRKRLPAALKARVDSMLDSKLRSYLRQ